MRLCALTKNTLSVMMGTMKTIPSVTVMFQNPRHKAGVFCALFALCLALFSSCVSMPDGAAKYTVYVTNTKKVPLLLPRCMDGTVDSLNLFTGKFGDTSFALQMYVYVDDAEISFVLLNEFGVDMGSLSYTGDSLTLDSAVFPKSLKPEYIVADFENAFYSADALQVNYELNRMQFECTKTASKEIRRILNNGTVIEEITKQNGVTTIQNFLRGYTYVLTQAED